MPIEHTVVAGDCLYSIAFQYGFFPATIWDAPENQELRAARSNPAVLEPGDTVFVPDLRKKSVPIALDRRHRVRRRGVPERLRFQFLVAGYPRANALYEIEVDGVVTRDLLTDGEGRIDHSIAPNARSATVYFPDTEERYTFALGRIDPIDTRRGVLARLSNLGFHDGPLEGVSEDGLRSAVARFQAANELPINGELDDSTRAAIRDAYDG